MEHLDGVCNFFKLCGGITFIFGLHIAMVRFYTFNRKKKRNGKKIS